MRKQKNAQCQVRRSKCCATRRGGSEKSELAQNVIDKVFYRKSETGEERPSVNAETKHCWILQQKHLFSNLMSHSRWVAICAPAGVETVVIMILIIDRVLFSDRVLRVLLTHFFLCIALHAQQHLSFERVAPFSHLKFGKWEKIRNNPAAPNAT